MINNIIYHIYNRNKSYLLEYFNRKDKYCMFVRLKKTDKYEYLQIVENRRVGKTTKQRVLVSLGRADEPRTKLKIEQLLNSLIDRLQKLKN